MSLQDWRPSADFGALRARAALLALTRTFFAQRAVLEVETPQLGQTSVTEPAIESLTVPFGNDVLYLQTSPEYAMKRLLAAGSGDIYQVARVFRAGEAGRRHNPEFTLLEWYRCGFDLTALIDETLEYICLALARTNAVKVWRYHDLLRARVGIDFVTNTDAELRVALASAMTDTPAAALLQFDRAALLDLAFDQALRQLSEGILVVRDFPPEAKALARLVQDADGRVVAQRFEVIVDGLEVANGYHELTDAAEQALRFAADNARRLAAGQPQLAPDVLLLAALAAGLPDCAGVAVGLDRLLMLKLGAGHIAEVLSFDSARA